VLKSDLYLLYYGADVWETFICLSFLPFLCFRTTSVAANDGEWHHICLSWERSEGSWKFYKDGDLDEEGDNFKKGHQITQGGTLVLGQEQDAVGGGFESSQSFQGMLSHVNLWDNVLPGVQIQEMSKSCGPDDQYDGNVYKWLDFLREGGPKLVKSPTCKLVEAGMRWLIVHLINIHKGKCSLMLLFFSVGVNKMQVLPKFSRVT